MGGLILNISDPININFIMNILDRKNDEASTLKKNKKGDTIFFKIGNIFLYNTKRSFKNGNISKKEYKKAIDVAEKYAGKVFATATIIEDPYYDDGGWGKGYGAKFNNVKLLKEPYIVNENYIKINRFGGHTYLEDNECANLLFDISKNNNIPKRYIKLDYKNFVTHYDELYVEEANEVKRSKFKETKISPIEKNSAKQVSVISRERNKNEALKAMERADYKCEIDSKHYVFKKKSNPSDNYAEPHHLIPLQYEDDFENSLDNFANIVCLCSNCHKEIHYGVNNSKLIKILYEKRKEELKKAGISIGLKELLRMYE